MKYVHSIIVLFSFCAMQAHLGAGKEQAGHRTPVVPTGTQVQQEDNRNCNVVLAALAALFSGTSNNTNMGDDANLSPLQRLQKHGLAAPSTPFFKMGERR